jgi:serine/threonine protein kinase
MNGQILKGRYQIVRELGSGGQGITYLTKDTQLSGTPDCVVKQLRPADPKTLDLARRLFKQEINALGQLGDHPQIPRLLDHFEEGGEFYLIQQYIAGDPLSKYIVQGQPWSENQVNGMLRELLPILDFIHSRGVIHRDIKPNNIIRRSFDQKLVLIDFGSIKQVISPELIITQQNQVRTTVAVGTQGYMAPEQNQGKAFPYSDLYALGMIGIEAATGIGAIDLQTQYSDPLTGDIIWRRLAPQISDNLANIISKMVAFVPGNRYQFANQVLSNLPQIYPTTYPPPPPTPTPTSPPMAVDMGNYANFWSRFAAICLDSLIVSAGALLTFFVILIIYAIAGGSDEGTSVIWFFISVLFGWLYYAIQESSPKQATVGKRAVGIVVTDLNGNRLTFEKATGRYFAKCLSTMTLGFGYIMAAFTEKKQALHDLVAGTLVVNKR